MGLLYSKVTNLTTIICNYMSYLKLTVNEINTGIWSFSVKPKDLFWASVQTVIFTHNLDLFFFFAYLCFTLATIYLVGLVNSAM